MTKRTRTVKLIPYTPNDWSPEGAAMHVASTLEEAFHHASCLTGGWYRRPVTVDRQSTEDNGDRYMLRPSEVSILTGWEACYIIQRATP